MLPRTLRNFSLFIDGQGFAGRVTECTLPTLEINLEEYRAGGLDAPVEIDQGMSASRLGVHPRGIRPRGDQALRPLRPERCSGHHPRALQRNGDTAAVSLVANFTGHIKNFDPGSLEAGAMTEATFTMGLRYYRLSIANEDLVEIDVENMVRTINGTDQLASLREAMGV